MSDWATILNGVAILGLCLCQEIQRRRINELAQRMTQAETNYNLSVGVHSVHRGCMEAMDRRMDSHAAAINQIAAHPACAPALGARIARLELMLLPQSLDAMPTSTEIKTRGGRT